MRAKNCATGSGVPIGEFVNIFRSYVKKANNRRAGTFWREWKTLGETDADGMPSRL